MTLLYLWFYTKLNFKDNWFSPVFTHCHYNDLHSHMLKKHQYAMSKEQRLAVSISHPL